VISSTLTPNRFATIVACANVIGFRLAQSIIALVLGVLGFLNDK
jgi:hypothetical protein